MDQVDIFIETVKENMSQFDMFVGDLNRNITFIVDHLIANSEILMADKKKNLVCLHIILHYCHVLMKKEENSESLIPVIEKYATKENCLNIGKYINPILRWQFNMFNQFNKNQKGYDFFLKLVKFYDPYVFATAKAYVVYFAYQLKKYHEVNEIVNTFYLDTQSDGYHDGYDFCMLNFYKGLILLTRHEFVQASFCFLTTFKAVPSNNVYSTFHLESFKRIVILHQIIDPTYRGTFSNFLNLNKKLMCIKPLELYGEIFKFFSNPMCSFKDLEKFAKDITPKLKLDKTNGLFKIAVKEFGFEKIKSKLISYKRIRLEKLANQIEMDKDTLVNLLKIFAYKNKIGVKIDEDDGIVEVLGEHFDEMKTINDLKTGYKNLNEIEKELVVLNFKKAEAVQKVKNHYSQLKYGDNMLDLDMQGPVIRGRNPHGVMPGIRGMPGSRDEFY